MISNRRWRIATISLILDVENSGSVSLQEPDACSHLWKFITWRFACRITYCVPKEHSHVPSQQLCRIKITRFSLLFSQLISKWPLEKWKIWTHSLLECCKSMSEENGTVSLISISRQGAIISQTKRHGLHVDRNTQRQTE